MPSKSRRNGEGSITQRKDGRWMARYYLTYPDGTKKRQHIIKKDREAVIKQLRDELSKADQGSPVYRNPERTVQAMAEYFMTEIDPKQVRPSTAYAHRQILEKHVIPLLGNIQLVNLKPEHVRRFIKTMEDRNIGTVAIRHSKDALSCILREAVKLEYIHRNVAQLVDYHYKPKRETVVWNADQVSVFLNSAREHHLYPLFSIMFQYGVRRGEILGLTWDNVDFDTNTIHIRQQITTIDTKRFIQPAKTNAGLRDLPMTPNIREILLEYQASEQGKGCPGNYLFYSKRGNPIDPSELRKNSSALLNTQGSLILHCMKSATRWQLC